MPKTTRIPASKVVLDYNLYPRHQVDDTAVARLVDALRAEEALPPIVVDAKSMRVVDGFHRVTAYQRFAGPDAKVPAEVHTYSTDAEMFADAVRRNARHGRPLSRYDLARCITRAMELKLDPETITRCAAISADTYDRIVRHKLATHRGRPVALKRTLAHFAGQPIAKATASANRRLGGMSQLFYVNQVLILLTNDLVDESNANLMEALQRLHRALEEFLDRHAATTCAASEE